MILYLSRFLFLFFNFLGIFKDSCICFCSLLRSHLQCAPPSRKAPPFWEAICSCLNCHNALLWCFLSDVFSQSLVHFPTCLLPSIMRSSCTHLDLLVFFFFFYLLGALKTTVGYFGGTADVAMPVCFMIFKNPQIIFSFICTQIFSKFIILDVFLCSLAPWVKSLLFRPLPIFHKRLSSVDNIFLPPVESH